MATSELMQLARDGNVDAFEKRCLEVLEGGADLATLATSFQQFERKTLTQKVATIGQMVLENRDSATDPAAALAIARVALLADLNSETLRTRVAELYRRVHGETPGFHQLLDLSGLESGRPPRNALRLLDFCLNVHAGDVLVSRTEGHVCEVLDVSLADGQITMRRDNRPKTVSALELSREFDRVDADDFRVLRQLRPQRLLELLESNPAKVIIDLIRVHENVLDQNLLKRELCPRYIDEKDWNKWWTDARAVLKRHPNVVMEGRSPVVLSYREVALTVEDELWTQVTAAKDPKKWLALVEGYLREKKSHKEQPSRETLQRIHGHIVNFIKAIGDKRPVEALGCALVAEKLDEECGLQGDDVKKLAVDMLRKAPDPAALIARIEDAALWERVLPTLGTARPEEAARVAVALIPIAPASQIDDLVEMARAGGRVAEIQPHIDAAFTKPHEYPEVTYWLWKGPTNKEGLKLPTEGELFTRNILTLSSLGRTLLVPTETVKRYRHRIKAAISLKDFGLARLAIAKIEGPAAITLRGQLERLDGLGDNTPAKLLDILRDVHPDMWRVVQKRIEQWDDSETIYTTRAGLQKKTEERDTLVNVTMRDNARRIGEAASYGDLSENSEYKFALEERDLLRARLAQMNNELSIAQTIEPEEVPTATIGVGSRVTFRRTSDGNMRTITFLGPFEADVERGILNYRAPVSRKLMGLTQGDRVTVALEGSDAEFEVISIENGLK